MKILRKSFVFVGFLSTMFLASLGSYAMESALEEGLYGTDSFSEAVGNGSNNFELAESEIKHKGNLFGVTDTKTQKDVLKVSGDSLNFVSSPEDLKKYNEAIEVFKTFFNDKYICHVMPELWYSDDPSGCVVYSVCRRLVRSSVKPSAKEFLATLVLYDLYSKLWPLYLDKESDDLIKEVDSYSKDIKIALGKSPDLLFCRKRVRFLNDLSELFRNYLINLDKGQYEDNVDVISKYIGIIAKEGFMGDFVTFCLNYCKEQRENESSYTAFDFKWELLQIGTEDEVNLKIKELSLSEKDRIKQGKSDGGKWQDGPSRIIDDNCRVLLRKFEGCGKRSKKGVSGKNNFYLNSELIKGLLQLK